MEGEDIVGYTILALVSAFSLWWAVEVASSHFFVWLEPVKVKLIFTYFEMVPPPPFPLCSSDIIGWGKLKIEPIRLGLGIL